MQVGDCDIFGDRGHRFPIPEATPDTVTDEPRLDTPAAFLTAQLPGTGGPFMCERSKHVQPVLFPKEPRPGTEQASLVAASLAGWLAGELQKTQASASPALNLSLHSDV